MHNFIKLVLVLNKQKVLLIPFCVVDGVGEPGTLHQHVHSCDDLLLLVQDPANG
jgi:hypothetical protein